MKMTFFILLISIFVKAQEPVGPWRYPLHVVVCGSGEPVVPYSVYISENFSQIAGLGNSWKGILKKILAQPQSDFKSHNHEQLSSLVSKTVFLKDVHLVALVPFQVLVDRCEIHIAGVLNLAPTFLEPALVINEDIWNLLDPYFQSVLFYEALALSVRSDFKNIFYQERNSMFKYREYLSRLVSPLSSTQTILAWDYQTRQAPKSIAASIVHPEKAQQNVTDSRNFILMPKKSFRLMRDAIPKSNLVGLITEEFEIQATPVTQSQWFITMGTNLSVNKEKTDCPQEWILATDRTRLCPNHPVENLSDSAIKEFIERLNQQDTQYKYSLPSELQWEYAAHADDEELYWKEEAEKYFTRPQSRDKTNRVMQTLPNPRGFYDFYSLPELTRDRIDWSQRTRLGNCELNALGECEPITELARNYGQFWIVKGTFQFFLENNGRRKKYVRSRAHQDDVTRTEVPQYYDKKFAGFGYSRPLVFGFRLVRVKK